MEDAVICPVVRSTVIVLPGLKLSNGPKMLYSWKDPVTENSTIVSAATVRGKSIDKMHPIRKRMLLAEGQRERVTVTSRSLKSEKGSVMRRRQHPAECWQLKCQTVP